MADTDASARLRWWQRGLIMAPLSFLLGAGSVAGYIGASKGLESYPLFFKHRAAEFKDPFTRTDLEARLEREFGIQIIGDKSDERLGTLDAHLRALREANPNLLSRLKDVYLVSSEDKDHISYIGLANVFSQIEIADRDIATLAHECAHVYHFSLADKRGFDARWLRITGDAYSHAMTVVHETDGGKDEIVGRVWENLRGGAQHGCVRPYGGRNMYEDVATFVEDAYEMSPSIRHADPADPRYCQKLDLLLEYGFLSPGQHARLRGEIGAAQNAPAP